MDMASRELSPWIKLNCFQRKMLHWDRTHPFNAVHCVRLAGRARPEQLRDAAWTPCREIGIGELRVKRTWICYETLQSIPLVTVPGGDRADATMLRLISEEINLPFPRT